MAKSSRKPKPTAPQRVWKRVSKTRFVAEPEPPMPASRALTEPVLFAQRDWFACAAINGQALHGIDPNVVAIRAYQLADAMLAERERRAREAVADDRR